MSNEEEVVPVVHVEQVDHIEHHNPTEAPEGEIVGLPTMLAKYDSYYPADDVLGALGGIGYPLEDVSVLFRLQGTDQVLDLTTGDVAAGQSVTEEEIHSEKVKGHTVVLLHPAAGQLEAVRQALSQVGNVDIEYSGETHALGKPGGVDRVDEQAT
jgi:hypothetical protein